MDFSTLFRDQVSYITETLHQKVKDSNVLKTTRRDDHSKQVEIERVHKSIYAEIFQTEEKVSCRSFNELNKILGGSCMRKW